MPLITIHARPERGFRRAGRFWSHEPIDIEVSDEDLVTLEAEPQLVVKRKGGKVPVRGAAVPLTSEDAPSFPDNTPMGKDSPEVASGESAPSEPPPAHPKAEPPPLPQQRGGSHRR